MVRLEPPEGMTFDAGRELDAYIAKLAGWRMENAAIYAPEGTCHGGDYYLHSKQIVPTPEQEDKIWRLYGPRFTTDLRYAFSLPLEDDWYLDLHGPTLSDPTWNGFVQYIYEFDEAGHLISDYRAEAEQGALALCLAWLQYVGVKRRIPGLQPAISAMLAKRGSDHE